MSILSKAWLRAWSTHPNLDFLFDHGNLKIVNTIMERYRDRKIPIEKLKLSGSARRFPLVYKWIEIALQNGVKNLSLRELDVDGSKLKIRAPTLEHLSCSCYSLHQLDAVECQNLKSLNLSYVASDGFLQHLISRQSLEVLQIQCQCSEGITEVDSPNLVSFEYTGDQIPQRIVVRESRKLKHSKLVLHCFDSLNDAWFCQLSKFLSDSTSWSQVSLYFPNCNVVNMKDTQVDVFVAIPQVDVLNVDILWQNEECPMFVDALLRSCHPRRLNLRSSIKMITCFIRRLLMNTNNPSLSSSQGSKPWHSQLIGIEVFDQKNQPLQLRSGWELAISTLTARKEVYFLLHWRCS